MDPAGTPSEQRLQSSIDEMLSATSESELFVSVGENGTALMLNWDGNLPCSLDYTPVSAPVSGKLSEATNQQSAEELNHAIR
jgi:hypothetical protein